MMRLRLTCLIALAAASPAVAQQTAEPRPQQFRKLIDCRAVADPATRLSCYDREVTAIDAAESRKELVILDRSQVRKAQRGLFGLPLPNLGIFGDNSPEAQSTIDAKLRSAYQNAAGRWVLDMDDGSRWTQADSRNLAYDPRPGDTVRIRRAALGSYLANIQNQTAIRVQRVR